MKSTSSESRDVSEASPSGSRLVHSLKTENADHTFVVVPKEHAGDADGTIVGVLCRDNCWVLRLDSSSPDTKPIKESALRVQCLNSKIVNFTIYYFFNINARKLNLEHVLLK